MKKHTKRLMSILFSLTLILLFCTPLFAADEDIVDTEVIVTLGSPIEYPNGVSVVEGGSIVAEDGCLLTVTVDGVEVGASRVDRVGSSYENAEIDEENERFYVYSTAKLKPGDTLVGKAVLTATKNDYTFQFDNVSLPPEITGGWQGGSITDPINIEAWSRMRQALRIVDGAVLGDYSVVSALGDGATYTGSAATDVNIDSRTDFFNGIVISGNTEYTIENAAIKMLGHGRDDFAGIGAAIAVYDEAKVTIKDSYIETEGAIRTGLFSTGTSDILVQDSVFYGLDADEASESYQSLAATFKSVPWVLGLEGNTRITNVLKASTVRYEDSIIVSNGWAALSTDGGTAGTNALSLENVLAGTGTLEIAKTGKVYDATKEVNGVTYGLTISGSGYVSYVNNVYNTIHNSQMYTPDYITILTGKPSSMYVTGEDTVAVSQRVGIMWHSSAENDKAITEITDGKWSVADVMFQVKSGGSCAPALTVDGTELELTGTKNYSGVLYQLMVSDDPGTGPFATKYTVPEQEADGYIDEYIDGDGTTATAVFKNLETKGDIYNAMYGKKQSLSLTMDNAKVEGIISSSKAVHVDADGTVIAPGTVIAEEETGSEYSTYRYAGRVINSAQPAINNDVELELKNGSTWIVTGTSFLSKLTVDAASKIEGIVYFNGIETTLKAGTTYEGNIVVALESTFSDTADYTWAKSQIDYVYARSLMIGTSATEFSPALTCNRAMAVTVLYRFAGEPAVTDGATFADVIKNTWYSDAVAWGEQNDIVKGDGTGFNPMGQVTREQLVTMIYRYAQKFGIDTSASNNLAAFKDVGSVSSWALDAMKWAVAEGLIIGRTVDTIVPGGQATRAEFAVIVARFAGLE